MCCKFSKVSTVDTRFLFITAKHYYLFYTVACTNYYKFSALMSRDNVQAKYTSTCSDSCTHVGPPLVHVQAHVHVVLRHYNNYTSSLALAFFFLSFFLPFIVSPSSPPIFL